MPQLDSPARSSVQVVVLRAADYKKVMSIFGGLGKDGRGGAQDLVLIPWEVLEEAGWAEDPETVRELQNRVENSFCFSTLTRRVEVVLHSDTELLKNPVEVGPPSKWRSEARDIIQSKAVTLEDLIPYDEAAG